MAEPARTAERERREGPGREDFEGTGTALEVQRPELGPRPLPVISDEELNRTWRLSEALAKSGFFKDSRQAAQAFAKIMFGRDLGLSPTEAMQALHVIEGRVEMSANLQASRVKLTPGYDYMVERLDEEGCVICFWRDNDEIGRSEFLKKHAEQAGLLDTDQQGKIKKDNWRKWPRNMYFARAMSNGVAFYCPEVMAGIRVYAEGEVEEQYGEAHDGSPHVPPVGQGPEWADVPWPENLKIRARLRAAMEKANELEANRWSPATAQMAMGSQTDAQLEELAERIEKENAEAEGIEDAEVVGEHENGAEATQEGAQEAPEGGDAGTAEEPSEPVSEPEKPPVPKEELSPPEDEIVRERQAHVEKLQQRRSDLLHEIGQSRDEGEATDSLDSELKQVEHALRSYGVDLDDGQVALDVEGGES